MTKYDFTDPPQKPTDPVELLAPSHRLLIEAGRALRVLSLRTGALDPILQQAAQGQAAFQAEYAQMGHQRWSDRSKQLFELLPGYTRFREVCAYSGYEEAEAADNILQTWRRSPDHWQWVNGRCDIWGYAMYRNAVNKLWYACGIFADKKT